MAKSKIYIDDYVTTTLKNYAGPLSARKYRIAFSPRSWAGIDPSDITPGFSDAQTWLIALKGIIPRIKQEFPAINSEMLGLIGLVYSMCGFAGEKIPSVEKIKEIGNRPGWYADVWMETAAFELFRKSRTQLQALLDAAAKLLDDSSDKFSSKEHAIDIHITLDKTTKPIPLSDTKKFAEIGKTLGKAVITATEVKKKSISEVVSDYGKQMYSALLSLLKWTAIGLAIAAGSAALTIFILWIK